MRRWLIVALLALLAGCGGTGGSGASYTPEQAIEAFKAAGLPADGARKMEPKDYGVGPKLGDGRIIQPTGLCDDCNIRVIAFDNDADLQTLKTYYDKLGEGSAMLASRTYVRGNLLVQMAARSIGDADAAKYDAALQSVK